VQEGVAYLAGVSPRDYGLLQLILPKDLCGVAVVLDEDPVPLL
jgi:hypothetical protein